MRRQQVQKIHAELLEVNLGAKGANVRREGTKQNLEQLHAQGASWAEPWRKSGILRDGGEQREHGRHMENLEQLHGGSHVCKIASRVRPYSI